MRIEERGYSCQQPVWVWVYSVGVGGFRQRYSFRDTRALNIRTDYDQDDSTTALRRANNAAVTTTI